MISKKITMSFLVIACFSLVPNIGFASTLEVTEMEKQEYKQERVRVKALRKSLAPGPTNDLKEYEKFADEIQNKWSRKDRT